MKAVMLLGTGFEPLEAVAPCDILRRGGVEVRLRFTHVRTAARQR